MADAVQIGGGPGIAKIRSPVAVAALSLITLGIYALYWWYQVNREMVDLGRARNTAELGDNPTISLLAFFPGALIIVPPFVSLYNGTQRMKRAQELTTNSGPSLNGWIVLLLLILGAIFAYAYMQAELNKAWRTQPRVEVGGATKESGPPPGEPSEPERSGGASGDA